jgi:hypothetical protein
MTNKKTFHKNNHANKNDYSLYSSNMITRVVILTFEQAGGNIKQYIESKISSEIEGKCIIEGFVEPVSVKVITYSSGKLHGNDVVFEAVIKCNICSPVEGMNIRAIAKNITHAGIRAEVEQQPSPVIIYISRDHHYNIDQFNTIKEGDSINTCVIGMRFELNDKYISIMSELIEHKTEKYMVKRANTIPNKAIYNNIVGVPVPVATTNPKAKPKAKTTVKVKPVKTKPTLIIKPNVKLNIVDKV